MQKYKPEELLNGRYFKQKKLGEGSYGTVFLAVDTKPDGLKRKLDKKHLQLLDKFQEGKHEDVEMSEEQKEAAHTLVNKQLVFDKNEVFEQGENSQLHANGVDAGKEERLVAIKKVKMNSFNVSGLSNGIGTQWNTLHSAKRDQTSTRTAP